MEHTLVLRIGEQYVHNKPTKVKLPWVLMIMRIPVCRSSRVMVINELTRGVPSERYY